MTTPPGADERRCHAAAHDLDVVRAIIDAITASHKATTESALAVLREWLRRGGHPDEAVPECITRVLQRCSASRSTDFKVDVEVQTDPGQSRIVPLDCLPMRATTDGSAPSTSLQRDERADVSRTASTESVGDGAAAASIGPLNDARVDLAPTISTELVGHGATSSLQPLDDEGMDVLSTASTEVVGTGSNASPRAIRLPSAPAPPMAGRNFPALAPGGSWVLLLASSQRQPVAVRNSKRSMSWDAAGRELVVGTVIRLPLVMEHYLSSHHRGRNWVISTFARDIPGVIFVRPEDDAHASPVLAVAARYVQAVAPEPSLSAVVVLDAKDRPLVLEMRVAVNADSADEVAFVAEVLLFGEHNDRPEQYYTPTGPFWHTAVGLRHSTSGIEGVVVGINVQRRMLQLALDEENDVYWEIMARAVTVLDEEPAVAAVPADLCPIEQVEEDDTTSSTRTAQTSAGFESGAEPAKSPGPTSRPPVQSSSSRSVSGDDATAAPTDNTREAEKPTAPEGEAKVEGSDDRSVVERDVAPPASTLSTAIDVTGEATQAPRAGNDGGIALDLLALAVSHVAAKDGKSTDGEKRMPDIGTSCSRGSASAAGAAPTPPVVVHRAESSTGGSVVPRMSIFDFQPVPRGFAPGEAVGAPRVEASPVRADAGEPSSRAKEATPSWLSEEGNRKIAAIDSAGPSGGAAGSPESSAPMKKGGKKKKKANSQQTAVPRQPPGDAQRGHTGSARLSLAVVGHVTSRQTRQQQQQLGAVAALASPARAPAARATTPPMSAAASKGQDVEESEACQPSSGKKLRAPVASLQQSGEGQLGTGSSESAEESAMVFTLGSGMLGKAGKKKAFFQPFGSMKEVDSSTQAGSLVPSVGAFTWQPSPHPPASQQQEQQQEQQPTDAAACSNGGIVSDTAVGLGQGTGASSDGGAVGPRAFHLAVGQQPGDAVGAGGVPAPESSQGLVDGQEEEGEGLMDLDAVSLTDADRALLSGVSFGGYDDDSHGDITTAANISGATASTLAPPTAPTLTNGSQVMSSDPVLPSTGGADQATSTGGGPSGLQGLGLPPSTSFIGSQAVVHMHGLQAGTGVAAPTAFDSQAAARADPYGMQGQAMQQPRSDGDNFKPSIANGFDIDGWSTAATPAAQNSGGGTADDDGMMGFANGEVTDGDLDSLDALVRGDQLDTYLQGGTGGADGGGFSFVGPNHQGGGQQAADGVGTGMAMAGGDAGQGLDPAHLTPPWPSSSMAAATSSPATSTEASDDDCMEQDELSSNAGVDGGLAAAQPSPSVDSSVQHDRDGFSQQQQQVQQSWPSHAAPQGQGMASYGSQPLKQHYAWQQASTDASAWHGQHQSLGLHSSQQQHQQQLHDQQAAHAPSSSYGAPSLDGQGPGQHQPMMQQHHQHHQHQQQLMHQQQDHHQLMHDPQAAQASFSASSLAGHGPDQQQQSLGLHSDHHQQQQQQQQQQHFHPQQQQQQQHFHPQQQLHNHQAAQAFPSIHDASSLAAQGPDQQQQAGWHGQQQAVQSQPYHHHHHHQQDAHSGPSVTPSNSSSSSGASLSCSPGLANTGDGMGVCSTAVVTANHSALQQQQPTPCGSSTPACSPPQALLSPLPSSPACSGATLQGPLLPMMTSQGPAMADCSHAAAPNASVFSQGGPQPATGGSLSLLPPHQPPTAAGPPAPQPQADEWARQGRQKKARDCSLSSPSMPAVAPPAPQPQAGQPAARGGKKRACSPASLPAMAQPSPLDLPSEAVAMAEDESTWLDTFFTKMGGQKPT